MKSNLLKSNKSPDKLLQFGIVLIIFFIGEVLSIFIPMGVPGNVLGMLLLFLLLIIKVLKLYHIEEVSNFLIQYLPFFFVPAAVKILESYDLIREDILKIIIIVIISSILTIVFTAYAVELSVKVFSRNKF